MELHAFVMSHDLMVATPWHAPRGTLVRIHELLIGKADMAGTLFFVHGTGVRHEGYGHALELVAAGLLANGLGDLSVVGCQWGDTIGDQFDDDWRELVRRTSPPETTPTTGAEAATTDAELETSSWEQLLRDPLMEL